MIGSSFLTDIHRRSCSGIQHYGIASCNTNLLSLGWLGNFRKLLSLGMSVLDEVHVSMKMD